MAYYSPYIDNTGIHVPTYEDIRDDLIASMKQIFGQDIYLADDSQDYQQICIFAKKIILSILTTTEYSPMIFLLQCQEEQQESLV